MVKKEKNIDENSSRQVHKFSIQNVSQSKVKNVIQIYEMSYK